MQANFILPLQVGADASPRAAGNSLGEAAGQAQPGGFFAQLQQAGQQFGDPQSGADSGLPAQQPQLTGEGDQQLEGLLPAVDIDAELASESEADLELPLAPTAVPGSPESVRVSLDQLAGFAGKGLPQGGTGLPHSAAATAQLADGAIKADGQPVLSSADGVPEQLIANQQLQDRRQPAFDRARFDVAQQGDAIRQPFEPLQLGRQPLNVEVTPEMNVELKAQAIMADKVAAPLTSVADQSSGSVFSAASGLSPVTSTEAARVSMGESGGMRPQLAMNTPMGEPGWAEEMGARLRILAERGNQTAEIRLNPPELGSMEVKIVNDGDRTSVTFFAQNSATREALEAAMPRLREMFGESGLQLADANVSQQQTMSQDEQGSSEGGMNGDADGEGELLEGGTANAAAVSLSDNLVDYYI